MRHRFSAGYAGGLFSLVAVLLLPHTADAFLIESVTVDPMAPILPSDPVSLDVRITTPSSPPMLTQPTELSIVGNSVEATIYVDSGPLTVLDSFTETLDLEQLPVGTYDYTVLLVPVMDIPFGRDQRLVTGEFAVVPEPTSLAMLVLLAGGIVGGRQVRRGGRR
jgi:hypothetical protein